MTELFQQEKDEDADDDLTPSRRRIRVKTLGDQERQVARCFRLCVDAFLSAPTEARARALAAISAELRSLRQDTEVVRRLEEVEARFGQG